MKSGRNATRRNRNVGTSKCGYGQDNKLVLPVTYRPELSYYFERLKNYKSASREINDRRITFLVEETRADCYHACTVDDIAHILRFVPHGDLTGIELIVLRQPKRKEEILNAAWRRWVPYIEIDDKYRGSAIILEAVPLGKPMLWAKSLVPDSLKELEKLKTDGHQITSAKKYHVISLSLASVRATQLYRTLLHEIGHHVDFSRNAKVFDRKPASEKEVFAHRYAYVLREELTRKGVMPFGRILSQSRINEDGLRMSDFMVGLTHLNF